MHRIESKAQFLFDTRQNLRIHADVVLEAERAVVTEDLGELAFGVDHGLIEFHIVGTFGSGHRGGGDNRKAKSKQSLFEHFEFLLANFSRCPVRKSCRQSRSILNTQFRNKMPAEQSRFAKGHLRVRAMSSCRN